MKTKLTNTSKSMGPFVFHPDHITHVDTDQKLPLIRISAKIVKRASVGAIVEFYDASRRRRCEELTWTEYRSWSKFSNKIISLGYCCNNLSLLKLLHNWYLNQDIPKTIHLYPAGGWWQEIGCGKKLCFLNTNIINWRSKISGLLHKGSCGQPIQYGSLPSNPASREKEIASWETEIAPACGRSPALTVAALSGLAAMLFPAAKELQSFCIFYGADEAADREVIRSVAASVSGAPRNFSILGKSPTRIQLVEDFRHKVVCFDIPRAATEKQILPFFESLLGVNGEISCVSSLPNDMRLLAFVTGPCGHFDNVPAPRTISVSAIVDPETRLYDDPPDSWTADRMNAWILVRTLQQKGGIGQKFSGLIERNQSKSFQIEVTRLINYFIKRLNPKTKDEKSRALAVSLLWTAGYLGIKWQILPWSWKVERVEQVLKQLFAASCKSLPDPQALEEGLIPLSQGDLNMVFCHG